MDLLTDGFSTTYEFAEEPSLLLEEISVKSPQKNMGGPIPRTTMRNTAWRTQTPKTLKTFAGGTATVAYASAVEDQIDAMLGVNQEITVNQPDGSSIVFWGWLEAFNKNENSEGERPTAEIQVEVSNIDGSNNEIAPVYNAP